MIHNELRIKVYYPSSFSSYVDYDDLHKQLNDYETEYRLIKTEKTIRVEGENVSEIKDKIEETQKRLIEIFGGFTTVVALIFGGISIFTSGDTSGLADNLSVEMYRQYSEVLLKQKLTNYFGFGFSLLLFDAFLLLLLNTYKKDSIINRGKTWGIIGLIIVSVVVVLECLFRCV